MKLTDKQLKFLVDNVFVVSPYVPDDRIKDFGDYTFISENSEIKMANGSKTICSIEEFADSLLKRFEKNFSKDEPLDDDDFALLVGKMILRKIMEKYLYDGYFDCGDCIFDCYLDFLAYPINVKVSGKMNHQAILASVYSNEPLQEILDRLYRL